MKHFARLMLCVLALVFPFVLQATSINLKEIRLSNLTKAHEQWYEKAFPIGFMSVYQDKAFVITKDGKPMILGPADIHTKKVWLLEAAKEEFQDYVLTPKPGYKAILIEYKKKPIGVLLYRMLEKEKTLYIAQYFISPNFHKKGVASHILLNTLPKLHPDYKRYEVLARHQNTAAFLLYRKAGFSLGDIELVKKYDYDPLRYMGFYKDRQ